ncbi:MAG: o-succinylbenzoate synthase, partial [Acidobacteriota bacterium]|nr:o-succinylbenzoate synthase [Acidobacteriota bacterium]
MSLTLAQLELREVRLPLRETFAISSGSTTVRRILLVRLEDADGREAWAECVAAERPNYSSETVDTAWLAIREWVAPRVLGRCFDDPGSVAPVLETNFRGHRMAKAAVEMGTWALEAERRGEPLARLLGGVRARIPVGISLGIQREPG